MKYLTKKENKYHSNAESISEKKKKIRKKNISAKNNYPIKKENISPTALTALTM